MSGKDDMIYTGENRPLSEVRVKLFQVDRGIAKYMADNFGSKAYTSSPIYERIGEDCGFCGYKPACCG